MAVNTNVWPVLLTTSIHYISSFHTTAYFFPRSICQLLCLQTMIWTSLIFCFFLKKNAAESHRILIEAYDEHDLGKSQCYEWLNKFKSGMWETRRNEEHGRLPKKIEDAELQALLDEDDGLTKQQLAEQLGVTQKCVSDRLKAIGKILK